MLLITCPWCGPRDEIEFRYGGQAHLAYPDPTAADDAEWAAYLFTRDNPKGLFRERWRHSSGCRRWFNALRDTTTNRILSVYPISTPEGTLPRDAADSVDASAGTPSGRDG